jgi:hypothetical protein
MAFIPIQYDIVARDVHGRPIYLTGKGWLFIFFLIFALVFGIWKIINDDIDSRSNKTAITGLNLQNLSFEDAIRRSITTRAPKKKAVKKKK